MRRIYFLRSNLTTLRRSLDTLSNLESTPHQPGGLTLSGCSCIMGGQVNDPTFICIPYLGRVRADLTKGLVNELQYQGEYCLLLLLNNSVLADEISIWPSTGTLTLQAKGQNIGQMWNRGWQIAQDLVKATGTDKFQVLFLNNDITISPTFVSRLASRLRTSGRDDLWAISPNQDNLPGVGLRTDPRGDEHALYGSAFMVKGEKFIGAPLFDERYHAWYHESDLANKIYLNGGYVGIALDIPYRHIDGGSLTTKEAGYGFFAPGVEDPVKLDTERFYEIYSEISWPDKVIPIGRKVVA